MNQTARLPYFLGFVLTAILLGSAFYLQIYDNVNPCPLCLLQRIAVATLCIIFIIGMIVKLNKWKNALLSVLGLLVSICGALFAARQVWLQWSPPSDSGGCGASLSYVFSVLPIKDAFMQVWQGGMECSQTGWQFLHLSLAAWSLIGFFILFLLTLMLLIRVIMK